MKLIVYGRPNVDTREICMKLAQRMGLHFTDFSDIFTNLSADKEELLREQVGNVQTYPESITNTPVLQKVPDAFSVFIDTPIASWEDAYCLDVSTEYYDCVLYQHNASITDIVSIILRAYDCYQQGRVQAFAQASVCFPMEVFTKFDVASYKHRSVKGAIIKSFGTVFFDNISVLTGTLRQGSFVQDVNFNNVDVQDGSYFEPEIMEPWLCQIDRFGGDTAILKCQFETSKLISKLATPNVELEFLRATHVA